MSIFSIIERVNHEREKKARKQLLTGMAFGVVIGVAAGILLAPKSGKQTRQELADAARQLPDKAKEFAELSKAKLAEAKEKLQASQPAAAEAAACQEPEK